MSFWVKLLVPFVLSLLGLIGALYGLYSVMTH